MEIFALITVIVCAFAVTSAALLAAGRLHGETLTLKKWLVAERRDKMRLHHQLAFVHNRLQTAPAQIARTLPFNQAKPNDGQPQRRRTIESASEAAQRARERQNETASPPPNAELPEQVPKKLAEEFLSDAGAIVNARP